MRNFTIAAATATVLALTAGASAQCESTELTRIEDPDGSNTFDGFGRDVSLWRNRLLVGEAGAGRAHMFREQGGVWTREALFDAHAADSGGFGTAVALEGDVAVVGVSEDYASCNDPDDCATGAVYVHRRTGGAWIEETKLLRPFYLDEFNMFGSELALDGSNLLVGASASVAGVVVPYEHDGSQWVRLDPIEAADGVEGDGFGRGLAIDGDLCAVGAPNDSDGGRGSGSVYLFRKSGGQWVQETKLGASDAGTWNRFGGAVALAGDLLVVGAIGDLDMDAGAIYIFRDVGGAWVEQAKLTPGLALPGDGVGGMVEIAPGGVVLAAALGDAHAGDSSGAAYAFREAGGVWAEQARLTASDAGANHQFGIGLAADEGRAAVGAWQLHGNAGGGAVYLFGGVGDCNANGALDLCDVVGGGSDDLNGNMRPDECETDCDLDAFAKLADAGWSGDNGGRAVAIDGDTAAVGRPLEQSPGSVDIYRLQGNVWTLEGSVIGEGLGFEARMGDAIIVRGDLLLAGAPHASNQKGAVAVFERGDGGWARVDMLQASDGRPDRRFGNALALEGDTLVIGARGPGGSNVGAAYVFQFDGAAWVESQKLTPSDNAPGTHFGQSVAIDDGVIAIGAWREDQGSEANVGATRIFERVQGVWTETAVVSPPDGRANDRFAYAIDLEDGLLLCGAPRDDDLGSGSGSAYLFDASNGWSLIDKLHAPHGAAGDAFGEAVALVGGMPCIGAPDRGAGEASLFRESGGSWTCAATLRVADGETGDRFGAAFAADGSRLLSGAPLHDQGGVDAGAAYAFHGIGDCNANGRLDACDLAWGGSSDADGDGEPDECDCRADFNGDGAVNTQDVLAFLNAYVAGDGSADFNGDGVVNTQDVLAFLNAWTAGC